MIGRQMALSASIVLAVLLTAFSAVSQSVAEKSRPLTVAQAIESIRPSTVQIGYKVANVSTESRTRLNQNPAAVQLGNGYRVPLGTGFLVNAEGYVITAQHVIDGGVKALAALQAEVKEFSALLAEPNVELPNGTDIRANFHVSEFDVVGRHDHYDLVLLKLKSPFPAPLAKPAVLKIKRPHEGEAIAISGYPLGQPVLVTNVGWLATPWSFEAKENTFIEYYLGDITSNPGNSGGPMYSIETGAVLGVSKAIKIARSSSGQEMFAYSAGLAIAVPARYIGELLNQHNVTWSEHKE